MKEDVFCKVKTISEVLKNASYLFIYLNVMLDRRITRSLSHVAKCKKFEFIRSSGGGSPELDMIAPAN